MHRGAVVCSIHDDELTAALLLRQELEQPRLLRRLVLLHSRGTRQLKLGAGIWAPVRRTVGVRGMAERWSVEELHAGWEPEQLRHRS